MGAFVRIFATEKEHALLDRAPGFVIDPMDKIVTKFALLAARKRGGHPLSCKARAV